MISTYSIVACDLEAREWGVAVQSKFLAVGAAVPAAEPEVGAIATQAWANLAYRPDGLALLREGYSAEDTVRALVGADDGREHRQLGVVDAHGRTATDTGAECMDWAGGTTGPGYAAQGNILVSAATVGPPSSRCSMPCSCRKATSSSLVWNTIVCRVRRTTPPIPVRLPFGLGGLWYRSPWSII